MQYSPSQPYYSSTRKYRKRCLGLKFYVDTFRQIKKEFPTIKLHTLGPPEVAHITKLEKSTHRKVLMALKEAGMDSLPGAGAEILVDRVRRLISKGKCGAQEWLDIMHEAHKLNITTSATMLSQMLGNNPLLHCIAKSLIDHSDYTWKTIEKELKNKFSASSTIIDITLKSISNKIDSRSSVCNRICLLRR